MEDTKSLVSKENQYENRGISYLTAFHGIFGLPKLQLKEEKKEKKRI